MEVSELHDISQPFGLASCHEQRLLLMAALDLSIIYLVSSYHYQKRNTRTQNVQALAQNLNDSAILDLQLDIIGIFVRQAACAAARNCLYLAWFISQLIIFFSYTKSISGNFSHGL